MRDEHNGEFVVAFAVGALLGVGAALLLAPDPPTRRDKIMKELKPYRKTLRKKTSSARKQMGRRASAAGDFGEELISAGRAVAADLREEIADLVSEARSEIAATVEDQLEAAQDALKKGAKRVRR